MGTESASRAFFPSWLELPASMMDAGMALNAGIFCRQIRTKNLPCHFRTKQSCVRNRGITEIRAY